MVEYFKQKSSKIAFYVLILVEFIFSFSIFFTGILHSADDLTLLHDAGVKQNYAALMRAIRSRTVSRDEFLFVVLGDSRTNMEVARKVYGQAAEENPAFILHTGDVVSHGTVAEYLQYHLPLVDGIAPVPLIPVPGNHEKGAGEDFAGFRAIYGDERFSFDFADSRFVGVNNSGNDPLRDSDLQYLDRELSKPGVKNKFVLMHIPAIFAEQGGKGEKEKYRGFTHNADAFHKLMVQQHAQAAFFGHDHGFAARTIDGVRYVITGGAGAGLHSNMDWVEKFYHYMVVHVSVEGVNLELVRLDGDRWIRSKVQ